MDSASATGSAPEESLSHRRESIDKKLQQRPDPQELKDRHILLDTKAAPYVEPCIMFPAYVLLTG